MEQEQQGSALIVVLFVVFFVGMAIAIIVQKVRRKGAQWSGVVIDKTMNEQPLGNRRDRYNDNPGGLNIRLGTNNQGIQRSYQLRLRDDGGKEFNWPVGEGVYSSVQVGDRLQKSPGTETPAIISRVSAQTPNQAVPTPASMPAQTPSIATTDEQVTPPSTPGLPPQ